MSARGDYLAENMIEKDITMGTDYVSKGITMGEMARLSIQTVCDNTDVAGKLTFECSNNNIDWIKLAYIDGDTNLKSEEYVITAGVDVNEIFDWDNLGIGYVRVKWTRSAGATGLMSIWAIRKRV
jgi:hypothetical protein